MTRADRFDRMENRAPILAVERKVRGVKRLTGYHGGCDAPQCHLQARWQIAFDTGARLHLCPRHKDEVVANYAERATP